MIGNAIGAAAIGGQFDANRQTIVDAVFTMQLPVDYQLAGKPPYREVIRQSSVRARAERRRVRGVASERRRLSGGVPSFTTRTGSRGYD